MSRRAWPAGRQADRQADRQASRRAGEQAVRRANRQAGGGQAWERATDWVGGHRRERVCRQAGEWAGERAGQRADE